MPTPVRHFLGLDHVPQAHVGRLETELACDEIDNPLHRKGGFRAAGAPIRGVRNLVGCGNSGSDGEGVDLVGAGQMHGGVVNHAGAYGIPRPAIDDETVAKRQDATFIVKADLDIVDLVA
jgi:hypothetical protein